jgi:hypothetical protein
VARRRATSKLIPRLKLGAWLIVIALLFATVAVGFAIMLHVAAL